jgi:hypothetical protein
MRRPTITLVLIAVLVSLVTPVSAPAAPRASLSRLTKAVDRLRADLMTTRQQLGDLEKRQANLVRAHNILFAAHNTLLAAHNSVLGCLERAATKEFDGYQFDNGTGLQSVFANSFARLTPGQGNIPFTSALHVQWSVGVVNTAPCMSLIHYREPGTQAALAPANAPSRVAPVRPEGAVGGGN